MEKVKISLDVGITGFIKYATTRIDLPTSLLITYTCPCRCIIYSHVGYKNNLHR